MTEDCLILESFENEFDPLQASLFKDLSDDSPESKSKGKEATDHLWKNFSFPPTPPISPACSPPYDTTDEAREQPVCLGISDEEFSLDDECSLYFQSSDLKDILIKDCMWNGAAFDKSIDRKQRFHSKMEPSRLLSQTPPLSESAARILSVDPSEIFPFPLSTSPGSEIREDMTDQLDSEEEEVEVDVVTIENSKREQKAEIMETEEEKTCDTSPGETSIDEPPCTETSSVEYKQDIPDNEKSDFVTKMRTRRHRKAVVLSSEGLNNRDGKKVVKNISSSGESDESENDSEFTRATHNVLERKRRNDLKLKFQKLRDCVPELKDNERAPKVSILRKSWEYISHIKQEEIKLLAELEKQKKMNAVLLRKLLALNQTS